MECYRCHGYGHMQRECPNQQGVAMQIMPDGSTVPVIEEEDQYSEEEYETGEDGEENQHLN